MIPYSAVGYGRVGPGLGPQKPAMIRYSEETMTWRDGAVSLGCGSARREPCGAAHAVRSLRRGIAWSAR